MPPRVRFAPSPTGYLHIGGARTALFNWLYARRHGGTFILRIEDTDTERSSGDMVSGILEGLRWLGLDWDEGPEVGGPHAPYFQSGRLDRYRAVANRLVEEGHAYFCYCSPERLRRERERAEAAGGAWQYDRTCARLDPARIAELEAAGAPRAIRCRVPDGRVGFTDRVRGRIDVDGSGIEDFVILRSDLHPTYHLSNVVDDVDMAITDVIRGDDHISNTSKHLLLYAALEVEPPAFAHVPLIFGPDRKRLSKRHGATSVMEYARAGYLPDAVVNFLALLGWSPGDDREILPRHDLVAAFDLSGISGGNAVFSPEKLEWMNGQYLAQMPAGDLAARVEPLLRDAGLLPEGGPVDRALLQRLLVLLQPRAKRLPDFVDQAQPFLVDAVEYAPEAVKKHLSSPELAGHVSALRAALAAVEPFEEAPVESALRGVAEARGIKAGALIHAARVALTGRMASPGIFEVIVLIGRARTATRLEQLETYLTTRP
ncbi:MAG: glutamate--tRNA ligase [Acidimicrobiia bacterium]|nr:glutamate--tRNA ligase [Acidimicrobiia bacterium]